MALFAGCVAVVGGVLLKDTPRQQARAAAEIFGSLVGAAPRRSAGCSTSSRCEALTAGDCHSNRAVGGRGASHLPAGISARLSRGQMGTSRTGPQPGQRLVALGHRRRLHARTLHRIVGARRGAAAGAELGQGAARGRVWRARAALRLGADAGPAARGDLAGAARRLPRRDPLRRHRRVPSVLRARPGRRCVRPLSPTRWARSPRRARFGRGV